MKYHDSNGELLDTKYMENLMGHINTQTDENLPHVCRVYRDANPELFVSELKKLFSLYIDVSNIGVRYLGTTCGDTAYVILKGVDRNYLYNSKITLEFRQKLETLSNNFLFTSTLFEIEEEL